MSSPFNSITEMANGWKHLPLPLLCEAVRADQDERFARGERPRAEDYFRTLPKLAGSQEDALVIIYGEIMNRAELGDTYLLEEYCERFPHWRKELQDILMLHDGLTGCRFNSTQVTTEKEVREPPVVPGYAPLEFMNQGGMGIVYRSRPLRGGPDVAIKFAHQTATATELLRLLHEAETLQRLSHPNIVPFIESGAINQRFYIISLWADGGTLADRLSQNHPTWHWGTKVMMEILKGVQAAHKQHIVHRDLKPANILLTENDRPMITDFGIARSLLAGGMHTRSGEVLGTFQYMPPEQIRGEHSRIGYSTDIYSLGVILFELITNRNVFQSNARNLLIEQILTTVPGNPAQINPDIPKQLDTVCQKCLQKEPENRYHSVEEMHNELSHALSSLQ